MKTFLISFFLLSGTAFAQLPVCTDTENAIIYESSAKVGQRVLILEPRLKVGNKYFSFAARNSADAASGLSAEAHMGRGVCVALGFKNGGNVNGINEVGDDQKIAVIDINGDLFSLEAPYGKNNTNGKFSGGIASIICHAN